MKRLLLVIALAASCLGAYSVASSVLYVGIISGFNAIKPENIPGTNYKFAVEASYDGRKIYYVQSNASQNKVEVVKGPESDLQYTLLKHRGGAYLIVKRPPYLVGVTPGSYFVWNITGNEPYFVSAAMSCWEPKLLGNHLEFLRDNRCATAGEDVRGGSIIELR